MSLLNPGDPFPQLTITTTGDQALTLPDALGGNFAVVLFYRGAWCPYCNAQLRAFQRASQALSDNGIRVAALSVDDQETTAALAEKHHLTFPVGYGADAAAIAKLTGAFVNPDPVYLQSTGFVLDPAGNVVVSVYSSDRSGHQQLDKNPACQAPAFVGIDSGKRNPAGRPALTHRGSYCRVPLPVAKAGAGRRWDV